jgi:hypothetical protein
MGKKIVAMGSGILGLGLLVGAISSSATAVNDQRKPGVGWLLDLGKANASKAAPARVIGPDPEKPDPAKPAKPDFGKADLAKLTPDPSKIEPLVAPKPDPAKVATPEPAKPAPAKPEPAKVTTPEPAKPAPAKPEPTKVATPEPKPAPAKPEPTPVAAKPEPKPAKTVAAAPAKPAEEEGIGTLSVNSTPPGGAIFLDGANVGVTPMEMDVPSGAHKLRVVHPSDGTDKRQTTTVKPNATTTIEVTF